MLAKQKWVFSSLILLLSLVLSACGDTTNTSAPVSNITAATGATTAAQSNATTAAQAANGPKTELRMTIWAGVDEAKEFQAIIDQINAKASNYKVTMQASPQEYFTKLQTGLASNTAADLIWIDLDNYVGYADKGSLMDITDRLKADKTNPAANLDDYFPYAVTAATYKNRIYGLPWIDQPDMLYVNLDLFKAAGLTPPTAEWTWDDFLKAAQKLTIDTNGKTADDPAFDSKSIKQWGFSTNSLDWPPSTMYIWQAGGLTITPDFKSSPVDSPEAVKGLQWYADLLLKYHVSPTASQVKDQGFADMFTNGKVAMFIGGAGDAYETRDTMKGQVQAYLVPKGPAGNRFTPAYIGFNAINAKTKYPDIAYQAMLDLTDAIQHWKVPVPRKSLSTKEAIQKIQPKRPAGSIDAILAAIPDAKPLPAFPNYAQWGDIWSKQLIDPLFRGTDTAANLTKKVRPLLEATLPK
jgi:multiple sugar transport system substrate-binding protein